MGRTLTLTTTELEWAILPKHEKEDMQIEDRIEVMLNQEEHEYKCFDYLAANQDIVKKAAKPVDPDCRVKMCEWCYQVVDFCKFRRETVGIGMSYLDRYLCADKGKSALGDRKEYQLVAMTCLYIAIKLHEPLEMETSLLADLSRGCYTEMEFANMEQKILEAVEWRVSGPTPLAFALHFLTFLPDSLHSTVNEAIFDYTRYQTELAISDHSFVKLRPSVVGMAAVMNAMEGMDKVLLPEHVQERFVVTVVTNTGIDMSVVDKTQTRLSNLLIGLLNDEQAKKYEKAVDEDSDDEEVDLSDYEKDDSFDDDEDTDESDIDEPSTGDFGSPISVTRKPYR